MIKFVAVWPNDRPITSTLAETPQEARDKITQDLTKDPRNQCLAAYEAWKKFGMRLKFDATIPFHFGTPDDVERHVIETAQARVHNRELNSISDFLVGALSVIEAFGLEEAFPQLRAKWMFSIMRGAEELVEGYTPPLHVRNVSADDIVGAYHDLEKFTDRRPYYYDDLRELAMILHEVKRAAPTDQIWDAEERLENTEGG